MYIEGSHYILYDEDGFYFAIEGNHYAVPGGKLEQGELQRACMLRELREEFEISNLDAECLISNRALNKTCIDPNALTDANVHLSRLYSKADKVLKMSCVSRDEFMTDGQSLCNDIVVSHLWLVEIKGQGHYIERIIENIKAVYIPFEVVHSKKNLFKTHHLDLITIIECLVKGKYLKHTVI